MAEALRYAADLLRNHPERGLVIFPQGNYTRGRVRPLSFQPGIAQIIRLVKEVAVVPVALHYEFFLQKRPELFIKLGTPLIFRGDVPATRALTDTLQQAVTQLLDCEQAEVDNFQVEQYRIVLEERRNLPIRLWHKIRKMR